MAEKKPEMGAPKSDKMPKNWEIIEDVEFDGSAFTPEILSFLEEDEIGIDGKTLRNRAKKLGANLGLLHAEYLESHQDCIPEWCRWFDLVFPGTLVRVRKDGHGIPCLFWNGKQWSLRFEWLDTEWNSEDRVVRMLKYLNPS